MRNTATEISSCTDIVNCLLEDHEVLKGYLSGLQDRSVELSAKRNLLREFLPLLELHTSAEEEVVLARALEHSELHSEAMEAVEEHELTDFLVAKIQKSANEDQWLARVKVLCESLEHHLQEEEDELFVSIRERISPAEREELGTRYREARQRFELAPVVPLPVRNHRERGMEGTDKTEREILDALGE